MTLYQKTRSSNHRGVSALKQLLLRQQRIQLLQAADLERVKESYNCENYSGTGHTLKTSTILQNVINVSNALTFCARLVKVVGKWKPRCTLNEYHNHIQ